MTEFRSVSGPARDDELTPDQVDALIDRGYSPRKSIGGSSWDPPPAKLVDIIVAVGLVLVAMMVVGLVGYWLVR
jgi:hypothetical protein